MKVIFVTIIVNVVLIFISFFLFVTAYGGVPKLEGSWFPASTPVTVTKTYVINEGVGFDGNFNILRSSSCKFRRIEWRLGKRGERDVLLPLTLGKPRVRSGGYNEFEGWKIENIELDKFNDTHADVFHDCGMPWLTVTPFYN